MNITLISSKSNLSFLILIKKSNPTDILQIALIGTNILLTNIFLNQLTYLKIIN